MTYILIIFIFGSERSSKMNVEFNDRASCIAAAAEVKKQATERFTSHIVLCAAKGPKP